MSYLLISILLLAGASLQTLLPRFVWFGGAEWPLLPGLLLYIVFKCRRSRILYASVSAGLLNDAFSPAPLGISIPFFVLFAAGVYAVRNEIFGDHILTYCVLGVLGALFQAFYFTSVFVAFGLRPFIGGAWAQRLLGGLFFGLVIPPVLYLLLSSLFSERMDFSRFKR